MDAIGPWSFKVNGIAAKVHALTMIDPVANLVKIARVPGTKAVDSSRAFVNVWLSRCPLPKRVVLDGGPEFCGDEWECVLMDWGLKKGRISTHTPAANSVIESSHKTMGQILRAVFATVNPQNQADMERVIADAIASAIRAMRCGKCVASRFCPWGIGVWSRHASQCTNCGGCCCALS